MSAHADQGRAGWRWLAARGPGKDVTIYSRNCHVFTPRFETIAYLLRELPAQSSVLDGEIVASDRRGVPNFARLHL